MSSKRREQIRNTSRLQPLRDSAIKLRAWHSQLVDSHVRSPLLRVTIEHLHGPQRIAYGRDELLVLCTVRNGEVYVKSFIEHYLSLGVKHLVLLDNDSTDETTALARAYDHVTILRTTCPYRTYETAMKRYLVRRFSQNRWSLFADIDELFDYPFSDGLSVRGLLTYLNRRGYTAVVAQMLDLFSDRPLNNSSHGKEDSLKAIYTYYDISNIERQEYRYGTLSNPDVKMHWGGVRKTVFGTNNGLTKAALMFLSGATVPFVDWHHVRNASLADFTGVLLHYPFVGTFYKKVQEAVRTDRYASSAARDEYRKYWATLKEVRDLNIRRETACEFQGVNELLQNGFLVVSEEYRRWVDQHRPGSTE